MRDDPIPFARLWWIPVVRGALSLLLGSALLVGQGDRAMLANFVGVYWLFSGLLTLRWALTVRWRRGSRIGLAAGSVSVAAAVLVLFRHELQHVVSSDTLINMLGIAIVLIGCLRLLGAFEIKRETGHRWTFGGLALGSVEMGLGLILLCSRGADLQALAAVLAVWGLVGGSLLLIEGFQLRRFARMGRAGSL